jgi:N-acyl-D-aspartate/D-glutamate deacylase
LGLDAGYLRPQAWADVIVIDPAQLKSGLGPPIEHYDPRLDGAMRMVKRSDGVVRQVMVGGRLAFENGAFVPEFGNQRFGRLLRATR